MGPVDSDSLTGARLVDRSVDDDLELASTANATAVVSEAESQRCAHGV